MRTTITLDDGLAADLKRRARTEGKSVSAVIAEAVRAQLGKPARSSRVAPFRLVTVGGGGLQPGVDVVKLGALDEFDDVERWNRRRR